MSPHDDMTRRILEHVDSGSHVSQRSLSRELGIALGLTNLLLRRLVRKGWITMVRTRPNQVRYLLTPVGLAEKARMSREYLQTTISFYAAARDQIRQSFRELSSTWPEEAGPMRVVFFGSNEVAEIAYVCLQQESSLSLVGIVDDSHRRPFFGMKVHDTSDLQSASLNGQDFDRLVVMKLSASPATRERLEAIGFPDDRTFWLT